MAAVHITPFSVLITLRITAHEPQNRIVYRVSGTMP